MKITPETKLKEIIPEGFEYSHRITRVNTDQTFDSVIIKLRRKVKTLEYYESMMLGESLFSKENGWLKTYHPKQYYSIILEMIADDICEKDKKREWVNKNTTIDPEMPIPGVIRFDTQEHVKYALNILGDKIGYLL